ncbi:hemolysin III family protein [soil metagenome]
MSAAGDDAPSRGSDPVGAAQDAASDAFDAARDAAAEVAKKIPKPRLRGVSHQWAAIASVPLGIALVLMASGAREIAAASIYAFSLTALLTTSAVYHRVNWRRDGARRWMRRLDHTMIFVLIAGTYTPFALLVMEGTMANVILVTVWACAVGGAILNLAWWDAPKWFTSIVYLATGWVAIAAMPQLWDRIGALGVGLLALGGALYTAGAVVYATRRPDPRPEVFGYHEIFHLLVIIAAAIQYVVIAVYALPEG